MKIILKPLAIESSENKQKLGVIDEMRERLEKI